jgi:hypothetical protein
MLTFVLVRASTPPVGLPVRPAAAASARSSIIVRMEWGGRARHVSCVWIVAPQLHLSSVLLLFVHTSAKQNPIQVSSRRNSSSLACRPSLVASCLFRRPNTHCLAPCAPPRGSHDSWRRHMHDEWPQWNQRWLLLKSDCMVGSLHVRSVT